MKSQYGQVNTTPNENQETKPREYGWPMSISNGFSSTYQEFRSTHFHAGIDIRTFKKNGFPVLAISDGAIFKIRMAKRGAGRCLFLKHDDGNISLYYHLDRFEPNLESILENIQKETGKKYFGFYVLKTPIRFKKGQLIAFSGESGAGFSHLHLEIRDKHKNSLNPLKYVEPIQEDSKSPVLKALLFRSRDRASVNGIVGETYIPFKEEAHDSFSIRNPLIITGGFDLILQAYDIADTGRPVAPYRISALLDNRLYFQLEFDRFKYDDNNQLGFVYDMHYSIVGALYFNLFSQKGFELEKKKISLEELLNNLENGEHEFRILVEDHFKNVSVGVVPFYKLTPPEIELSNILKVDPSKNNERIEPDSIPDQYQLQLDIENLKSDPAGEIKINVYNNDNIKISSGILGYASITEKQKLILNEMPRDAAYIDFDFYFNEILYFKKKYLLNNDFLSNITDVSFDVFINRDEVFLKIKDPGLCAGNVLLKTIQGDMVQTVAPQCSKENIFFRCTPYDIENNMWINFSILKDNIKIAEIQKKLDLIYLREGAGSTQTLKYNEFEAEFAGKSVYAPKVLVVEEKNYKSSIPIESKQISIFPYHVPFHDTVLFKFKKKLPNPKQIGIGRFRGGGWTFRSTSYNPTAHTFSTRVISPGVYALLRDKFPPRIRFWKPASRHLENVRKLVVGIWDYGKGVNDNMLRIWLNRKEIKSKLDYDYDIDWGYLVIKKLDLLKKGRNHLKIKIKDYAGNKNIKSFTFILK